MKSTTTKSSDYAARETRKSLYWVFWSFVYGISLALSSIFLEQFPANKLLLGILAMFITAGIGIAAFVAFLRLFKSLDERLQKIWLESLAMTVGVLWIIFGCLIILHKAEINQIDSVDIGLLSLLAGLGFVAGAIRTMR